MKRVDALWMPTGSVRGLIFLMLVASVCYCAVFKEGEASTWAFGVIRTAVEVIIGFYFGAKVMQAQIDKPSPDSDPGSK